MNNPYLNIVGNLPSQIEMSKWPHTTWLAFLNYILFFLVQNDENGHIKESFDTCMPKIKEMEKNLETLGHPYLEFIYRVNVWADETTPKDFYHRLAAFYRHCLTYIKKHPSIISTEMHEILSTHDRLNWALTQYKVEQTGQGEVVVRENDILTGFKTAQTQIPSIQSKMLENTIIAADLLGRFLESFRDIDLKKMSPNDRLKAVSSLIPLFSLASKKTSSTNFTQINMAGNARDMEKQSLAFLKNKDD